MQWTLEELRRLNRFVGSSRIVEGSLRLLGRSLPNERIGWISVPGLPVTILAVIPRSLDFDRVGDVRMRGRFAGLHSPDELCFLIDEVLP
jgi:hypothetical protein